MVIIMFGRYVYVCLDDDVKACMVINMFGMYVIVWLSLAIRTAFLHREPE